MALSLGPGRVGLQASGTVHTPLARFQWRSRRVRIADRENRGGDGEIATLGVDCLIGSFLWRPGPAGAASNK